MPNKDVSEADFYIHVFNQSLAQARNGILENNYPSALLGAHEIMNIYDSDNEIHIRQINNLDKIINEMSKVIEFCNWNITERITARKSYNAAKEQESAGHLPIALDYLNESIKLHEIYGSVLNTEDQILLQELELHIGRLVFKIREQQENDHKKRIYSIEVLISEGENLANSFKIDNAIGKFNIAKQSIVYLNDRQLFMQYKQRIDQLILDAKVKSYQMNSDDEILSKIKDLMTQAENEVRDNNLDIALGLYSDVKREAQKINHQERVHGDYSVNNIKIKIKVLKKEIILFNTAKQVVSENFANKTLVSLTNVFGHNVTLKSEHREYLYRVIISIISNKWSSIYNRRLESLQGNLTGVLSGLFNYRQIVCIRTNKIKCNDLDLAERAIANTVDTFVSNNYHDLVVKL